MALTYTKLFQPVAVPNIDTLIFTVPSAPSTCLLLNGRVRATNNSGSAVAITLYAVKATDMAGSTNVIVNAKSINTNDYLESDLPQLAAGDSLWAKASSSSALILHYMDGVIRS